MTRIYTPKKIELSQIPTSDGLKTANSQISNALMDLNNESKILGATSYGSLASPNKPAHVSSDLDWLIVFNKLEDLAECQVLADLIESLKRLNLDFSNPIISLDSIKQGNHIIGPIIYSIKANSERVIIGQDPIEFFEMERGKLIETISKLVHTYTRYFYENLVHYPSTKEDLDKLIQLLQIALNFFLDTYRSMQIIHDEGKAPVNFQKYLDYYQDEIEAEVLSNGLKVSNFVVNYRRQIESVVSNEDANGMGEYISFIKRSRDVIISSAKFCRGNIDFFRTKINGQDYKQKRYNHHLPL